MRVRKAKAKIFWHNGWKGWIVVNITFVLGDMKNRVRPRFYDQVGHQTTNASIGNKYFFTKKMSLSDLSKLWTEPTKIGHIFSK